MPEVLLSNDDITVLGPPEIVEVLVDIGPTGTRGSQIFVGLGNPNDIATVIGGTPIINDLYIDSSPGADYGYLYQYKNLPGVDAWTNVLKIDPAIYSTKETPSFSAGAATVVIPISNITSLSGLTESNFCVRCSIDSANPIAISANPTISGANLSIALNGVSYSGGSWSTLSGTQSTNIFITLVEV
jgi:hypothetical protein